MPSIGPPQSQNGVSGFQADQRGIQFGVWGDSDIGPGVVGATDSVVTTGPTVPEVETGAGVLGVHMSSGGVGVHGACLAPGGVGLRGVCLQGTGVLGLGGGNLPGVSGTSTQGVGVLGHGGGTGAGVSGTSTQGVGVLGQGGGTGAGVSGTGQQGPGVSGTNPQGVGVLASGQRGIVATGSEVAGDFTGPVNVSGPLTLDSEVAMFSVYSGKDGKLHIGDAGTDLLTIAPGEAGVDFPRRVRLRQGPDGSAGLWLFQRVANTDRAFIGMKDDNTVGFYGRGGIGWGLWMDVNRGDTTIIGGSVGLTVSGNTAIQASGTVAGVFNGNVVVNGTLSKQDSTFRIDHPLAPAEKYLFHAAVESPEMTNLYDGTVVTDGEGNATVALPDYFEALNRDYRYQLTPVGELALAAVTGPVHDNSFTIRTDKPRVTVCWQVTGVRQDRWANAHRVVPEVDKPEAERGLYLQPELHGEPASKSMRSAGPPST
ncbi:hypothetical protein ACPC54_39890 [Kitasatospora sp. NPDC094028]